MPKSWKSDALIDGGAGTPSICERKEQETSNSGGFVSLGERPDAASALVFQQAWGFCPLLRVRIQIHDFFANRELDRVRSPDTFLRNTCPLRDCPYSPGSWTTVRRANGPNPHPWVVMKELLTGWKGEGLSRGGIQALKCVDAPRCHAATKSRFTKISWW